MPPAVTIRPSAAIASVVTPTTMPGVTPAIVSGLPALPMPTMRPPLMPMSALRMPVQSTIRAFVITQSSASASRRPDGLALCVAQHLAAAELALVAIGGRVRLDLDHERGVAEAHPVAGRRPEHRRVLPAWQPAAHATDRASSTSCTERDSPGSKRTAVPAGMSSRMRVAASRSNSSARLTSANG